MEPTEKSGLGGAPQAFSAWFTVHISMWFWTQHSDRLQEAPHGIEAYPVLKVYPLGQSLD